MLQHESPPRDGPGGSRRLRSLGLVALGGVVGIALTAAVLTTSWWPRYKVVHRDQQSSAVTYPDESQHYVGLVREHTLSGRESYRVVAGRDPGLSYGHHVGIDVTPGAVSSFGVESTEWTTAGVRVRFNTGHELFIPAEKFMYGR